MPRAPRIEFAGALYHVMNRGNHLEPIFRDEADRIMFLKTLAETGESAGWSVHGFVLMTNHYHLLIETHRPTLVKGMQHLNSTYTQRYNVRHKTRGHLFQGRYKALLVDAEAHGYFLTVSDYIHLNPVRMKGPKRIRTLKELLGDRWSSAGWLAGSRKGRPEWLRWERVYGELGLAKWRSGSRREDRQYLERRMAEARGEEEAWTKIRRGWCLGSEGFVDEMKEKLEELSAKPRKAESWSGEAGEEMEQDRAGRYLERGARLLGYSRVGMVKGVDRYLLAGWARQRTKVSVQWLASEFGLKTRGGMSYGIRQAKKRLEHDRLLRKRWDTLTNHETRTDP